MLDKFKQNIQKNKNKYIYLKKKQNKKIYNKNLQLGNKYLYKIR